MDPNLQKLHGNVKRVRACFEKLASEIMTKLNECNNCIRTAENLCEQVVNVKAMLDDKLINVNNDEKEWKEIKLKLATTAIAGKIILDVGGEKYTTSVETLTREKDTFFTALFSKQWQLERDPDDKSVFIDRDGKLFSHILAYLRTNTMPSDILDNDSLRQSLITEARFFRLHTLIHILTKYEQQVQLEAARRVFFGETLLRPEYTRKLNEFYGKTNQQWQLLYKATRDGFAANAFHTRCDNQGPTITIVQSSNNYLFGGYASTPWSSDGGYKEDTNAFLFTLTNPHSISPTKYLVDHTCITKAVYHGENDGPTFGNGQDLYISNGCNTNNSSCSAFPHTYMDTTGKGNETFTGADKFIVSDIEVFKLV
ncbi:unnamed protein product [Adineta ricciae]|uniref:TLDc domain-containing protein n=1 Tax=Adineta ricciae TaxID=249248 RepID=A0A815BXV0_ADIRI|nr:unnamed protein product [Adineta ricciae]CAF1276080.1 unnamed protein product [Adineta ricciae]